MLVGVKPAGLDRGDSDAHRDVWPSVRGTVRDTELRHSPAHGVGGARSIGAAAVHQDGNDLLAAIAGHDVERPAARRATDCGRDLTQAAVTLLVSVAVVVRLEMID